MISFKEHLNLIEEASEGLAAKAKKSGISISILRKVYDRGMAAWNSGHRPGTTPEQWGMARVNSYVTKGKGTYHGADADLREEEILENNLPEVPKDKDSGLPKKYVAGLSKSTAKARAAHFEKADKLSDSDPRAYKPAPGDAEAKTKESKHTKKYREMFGEDVDEELYEACWDGYKQVGVIKKGAPTEDEFKADQVDEASMTHYVKVNNALKTTPSGAHIMKFPDKASAQRHANEHKKRNPNHDVVVTTDAKDSTPVWHGGTRTREYVMREAAVDAKGHKSSTGGLTQKGRDAYNAKGANLQAPVTTPPSKLDPDSKAAKRRKSFCARMGGMEGPMKKPNGEPTRKALALRKWNC